MKQRIARPAHISVPKMAHTWWIHYIFIIFYLNVNLLAASQSGEVVQCELLNSHLKFYCHGSVEEENSNKGSYFCCGSYSYCVGGNWNYKEDIHSIQFMAGCQFSRFELNIFKSYVAIQELDLSNVGLEALRLQDFTYAEHLEIFDASHNKLTEISAMMFTNAPEIAEVDFSFNEISRIDPMAFENPSSDHSSKISSLDLSQNKIISIDNRTFAALSALNTLYLSSNLIQVIEADVFIQNKELSVLQLAYNKLTKFACQYFENLSQLDVMNNSLTSIDGNCISNGNYLNLNIEYNRLTNVTINSNYSYLMAASNDLQWINIESDLTDLETFNVSKNRIENIPEILNRLGKTLMFLDLTGNFVGRLNVSTFIKMENLVELALRNTTLSNIQYGTFHHLRKLKRLDISFNQLKMINFKVFSRDLRALETFLLDGNDLTEVNGLSKINFPKMTLIGITKNNFTCEYLGEYMWQWTGVTFVSDALLLNQSHVEKIACNEYAVGDYAPPGFINYATQKLGIESVTTFNRPAIKVIEYIDNDSSTNRVLLVLVLVVLCIICVVVVTKNVILIWRSRNRRLWLGGEGNVTYCNERHGHFDSNSVEIINTDLLHASD